jgi:hypothetical protein
LKISPADFEASDTDTLKTFFIIGCNVLDVDDLNDRYATHRRNVVPPSPGRLWRRATKNGKTLLLGYNFPVGNLRAQAAFGAFPDEANRLKDKVPDDLLLPLAWLSANRKEVGTAPIGGTPMNCCALDDKYYYFFWLPSTDQVPDPLELFEQDDGQLKKPQLEIKARLKTIRIPLESGTTGTVRRWLSNEAPAGYEDLSIPTP